MAIRLSEHQNRINSTTFDKHQVDPWLMFGVANIQSA